LQDIHQVRVEAAALVKYMVSMKATGEFNASSSRNLYDAIKSMVEFQKSVSEVSARAGRVSPLLFSACQKAAVRRGNIAARNGP
jgi:hypothetical protein